MADELSELRNDIAKVKEQVRKLEGKEDEDSRRSELALLKELVVLRKMELLLVQSRGAATAAVPVGVDQTVSAVDGRLDKLEEKLDRSLEALESVKQLTLTTYANQHMVASSSGSTRRRHFRSEAMTAYSAINNSRTETWCAFTGMWWPTAAAQEVTYVRNARILGRSVPESSWLEMQLGRYRDVLQNVVPMMASVQVAFHEQRMCALPTEDGDFVIHILDPELMDQQVHAEFCDRFQGDHAEWTPPLSRLQERVGIGAVQATTLTFGQLDGQPLVFRSEQRPAKRCIMFHAFWALQRAKMVGGWRTEGLEITGDYHGWQSPVVEERLRGTALWVAMDEERRLHQEIDGGSDESSAEMEADASW